MQQVLLFIFFGFCCCLKAQKKQFELILSTDSGITFENTIVDTKEHNILLYANYYGGGGVGVADFNNDGLTDIYFTGNLVGDRLYLNKGNLKFEDITLSAGIIDDGSWSSGVSIADVNGDGFQDVYVSKELYDHDPERRRNKLYINQGNLTFKEEAKKWGIANSERSRQAVFFDYNNDGYLDLFVLNHPPNPGSYSEYFGTDLLQSKYASRLYRNIENIYFEEVTEQANILRTGFPNSAVATDINNDGWTDLYVANDFEVPDFLFINNGDGTFTYRTESDLRHTSFYSMGVDIADIDNDGLQDIMVLDMTAEDNYRLKANMSGMNVSTFWKVVANGGHFQYMFNTLQRNNGNGSFSDVAQISGMAATDWSWSNLIADFNNDGEKDVFVTNGLLRDIRNTDADKALASFVLEFSKNYIKEHPKEGDINIWDILPLEETLAVLPSSPLKNYMFQNHGDLKFKPVTSDWGLDEPSFSNGAAYADLDNDGDLEIIVNNVNAAAFLYKNNSVELNQNHFIRIKLENNKKPIFGTKVTLFQKQQKQMVVLTNIRGMYSTSEHIAHFGLGSASVIDSIAVQWPEGGKEIFTDLDIDQTHLISPGQGQLRLQLKYNENKGTVFTDITAQGLINFKHKENIFDDYKKQVLLPHKLSQMGPALAKADVNQDGLDDVFIGGASGQTAQLFLQQKGGTFSSLEDAPWKRHRILEDIDAVFFDADNDGDQDLYVVSGGNAFAPGNSTYLDRLYINSGDGNFSFKKERLPEIFESGAVVKPIDFDQDGDVDLFIGNRLKPWNYPEPVNSYLLENINGTFVIHQPSQQLFRDLGMVTDAVWSDYDSDGDADLFVVGEWMPLVCFENQAGNFIRKEDAEINRLKGWWYSIEKGDLDQDGDEDLVLGNLGKNYKYKASDQTPFEVYYHDFDTNGQKDIVLTYYNYGIKYPLRGFSCSSGQVPSLKRTFKNYDSFARLNVSEVYGNTNLSEAYHLSANTFESLTLINEGNGKFKKIPLPNKAQLSSINDILIKDFNSDDKTDILTIGNLYVSEVETPRNDAGIGSLMLGDIKNNFTTLPIQKSGLFVPGDAKKMIEININEVPHLLVVNNNDLVQLFTLEENSISK